MNASDSNMIATLAMRKMISIEKVSGEITGWMILNTCLGGSLQHTFYTHRLRLPAYAAGKICIAILG